MSERHPNDIGAGGKANVGTLLRRWYSLSFGIVAGDIYLAGVVWLLGRGVVVVVVRPVMPALVCRRWITVCTSTGDLPRYC